MDRVNGPHLYTLPDSDRAQDCKKEKCAINFLSFHGSKKKKNWLVNIFSVTSRWILFLYWSMSYVRLSQITVFIVSLSRNNKLNWYKLYPLVNVVNFYYVRISESRSKSKKAKMWPKLRSTDDMKVRRLACSLVLVGLFITCINGDSGKIAEFLIYVIPRYSSTV